VRYDVFVFPGLFADCFWETFSAVVEYDSIQIFGDRIDRAFLRRVTANTGRLSQLKLMASASFVQGTFSISLHWQGLIASGQESIPQEPARDSKSNHVDSTGIRVIAGCY